MILKNANKKQEPELHRDLPPEKEVAPCPGSSPRLVWYQWYWKWFYQKHYQRQHSLFTTKTTLKNSLWPLLSSLETIHCWDIFTSFNSSCCMARWQIRAVRQPWFSRCHLSWKIFSHLRVRSNNSLWRRALLAHCVLLRHRRNLVDIYDISPGWWIASELTSNASWQSAFTIDLVLPVMEVVVEDMQLQGVWILVSTTFRALPEKSMVENGLIGFRIWLATFW